MVRQIVLKKSGQVVLLDDFAYDWLATDPHFSMLKLLTRLSLNDKLRVIFIARVKQEAGSAKLTTYYLHNLIAEKYLGHTKTMQNNTVGNINGIYLDCRLENLRYQPRGTNLRNGKREHGKTQYRGIHPSGKWYKAVIYYKKKHLHFGYFPTAREAALAFNAKAIEIFGDAALLNTIPANDVEVDKLNTKKSYNKKLAEELKTA